MTKSKQSLSHSFNFLLKWLHQVFHILFIKENIINTCFELILQYNLENLFIRHSFQFIYNKYKTCGWITDAQLAALFDSFIHIHSYRRHLLLIIYHIINKHQLSNYHNSSKVMYDLFYFILNAELLNNDVFHMQIFYYEFFLFEVRVIDENM